MDVETPIRQVLPKATVTPCEVGLRVRVPGCGRGKTGGAWALVLVQNGKARFKLGLALSRVYDDPHDLAHDLARQFTTTASTYA